MDTMKLRPTSILNENLLKDSNSDTSKYQKLREQISNRNALLPENNDELQTINEISIPCCRKLDWDYKNPKNFFRINLGEGIGFAWLPRICKKVMDTEIFTRLEHIKQLGLCYRVYPDANHSRHTHSIGTAHFACKLARKLQEQTINGEPPMTGNEFLCVVFGALCHDLGHGPFSHLCEKFMIQEDKTKITHEKMSVLLFEKILKDYPSVKDILDRYFDDYHYQLIKELINPAPAEPWKVCGGPEKAFLYAIVNNPINGLDVDKMDYLLRDSKRTGVNGIKLEDIDFCFANAKIVEIKSKWFGEDYKWLGFPRSKPGIVSIFFEKRQYLHEHVYSHRTVVAVAEMMTEAIELALPEVKLSKDEKVDIPLTHCFRKENLDLYIMLTDEYLRTQILYSTSTSDKMCRAKQIIRDIDNRKFWKSILAFQRLDSSIPHPHLKPTMLKSFLQSCNNLSFQANEIRIVRRDFNAGKGLANNPMNHIPFYPGDNDDESSYMDFPKPPFESAVFIIVPHGCKAADVARIENALREYSNQHGIPRAIKLFKTDENSA